jgi:hypothetical protein
MNEAKSLSNSKVDVANKWEAPAEAQQVSSSNGSSTGFGLKYSLGKCGLSRWKSQQALPGDGRSRHQSDLWSDYWNYSGGSYD